MDIFKSSGYFHNFKGRNDVGCKTISGERERLCQEYTDHWSDEILSALMQGCELALLMHVRQHIPLPYYSTVVWL